jgi:Fur family ferric uptake transcriptional regulator
MTGKSLRQTKERFKILDHICQLQSHFDVEMLRQHLEENSFHVSRSSVYNTIELLMNAGLVVRHQFSAQLAQYELKSAAITHHHVICTLCGAVKEIKNDKISREITIQRVPKFTHQYHSVYIYGLCSKCKFKLYIQKKQEQTD